MRRPTDGGRLRPPGYSLPQRVDDLEAARKALGYDRVDLVSESAGTRTAMIYAWRYPKSVHRSVMVAVNPRATSCGMRRPPTSRFGATPHSARRMRPAGAVRRTSPPRSILPFENVPERRRFLPVREGNVKAAAFFGLMESTHRRRALPHHGRSTRSSQPATVTRRCVAPVADGPGCVPERAALGRRRRSGQDRCGVRPPLLREPLRRRIDHRHTRCRPDLGRRRASRLVAGDAGPK